MPPYYFDREGRPLDLWQWAAMFEDGAARRVAEDDVGGVWVSTVWLGLDHSFGTSPRPLIFETMCFGGPLDQEPRRYATEAEALAGHAEVVTLVRHEVDLAKVEGVTSDLDECARGERDGRK